ncbi:unnamed protein product [Arabis nemorensis]|uniref:Uncharacterized protein n=1 Tax=Arabis nemorensis TaxID=586526 RepID=A0A565AU54_9BRAS|nr:unnamed protein product [Arabis nemorensis]
MAVIVLSSSLQSFPPSAAIRSSHLDYYLRTQPSDRSLLSFRKSPSFRNADECLSSGVDSSSVILRWYTWRSHLTSSTYVAQLQPLIPADNLIKYFCTYLRFQLDGESYRENWPCKVMDKHMSILTKQHSETRFAKIQAEKWMEKVMCVRLLRTYFCVGDFKIGS